MHKMKMGVICLCGAQVHIEISYNKIIIIHKCFISDGWNNQFIWHSIGALEVNIQINSF